MYQSVDPYFFYAKIAIITRISRKFTTIQSNLMIFASFKRRESDLSIHGLLANFEQIHGKLQSN